MSLIKSSLVAGGSSLQTYVKDGNNIHTDSIEEWIFLEATDLALNTDYFWRISEQNRVIRLMSLWAVTTGTIYLRLQYQRTDTFLVSYSGIQANAGIAFPSFVIPPKYDLAMSFNAPVSNLILTAKEVSVTETLTLSKQ